MRWVIGIFVFTVLFSACFNSSKKINIEHKISGDSILNFADFKLKLPGSNKTSSHIIFVYDAECPICKAYHSRLQKMADSFATENLVFNAIIINYDSGKNNVQFNSNIQKQIQNQYTFIELLEMKVAPEVVVVNPFGKIIYRGKIDDQVYGTGRHSLAPKNHYLQRAIAQLIGKKYQIINYTQPQGCYLENVDAK
jgi:hypothetical protein